MGPARRAAIGERENRVDVERHIPFVQAGDHFANAVLADELEAGEFAEEFGFSVSMK